VSNDATGAPASEPMTDTFGLPFTTLGYANGGGHHGASDTQPAGPKRFGHRLSSSQPHPEGRADLSAVDTTAPTFLQESMVPMGSETHGGEDVPIYAHGVGAERIGGVVEQSVIYYALEAALRDRLDPPPAD
jgi:Alkaline phosphatase